MKFSKARLAAPLRSAPSRRAWVQSRSCPDRAWRHNEPSLRRWLILSRPSRIGCERPQQRRCENVGATAQRWPSGHGKGGIAVEFLPIRSRDLTKFRNLGQVCCSPAANSTEAAAASLAPAAAPSSADRRANVARFASVDEIPVAPVVSLVMAAGSRSAMRYGSAATRARSERKHADLIEALAARDASARPK